MKIKLFHAPKTSGCSFISANLAIHESFKNLDKNIAFIEINNLSTIDHQLSIKTHKSWEDLLAFKVSQEWDTQLFQQFPQIFNVQFFPTKNDLNKTINVQDLKFILSELSKNYDTLYIDLGACVSKETKQILLTEAQEIFLVSTTDPTALKHLNIFKQTFEIYRDKTNICLNQCEVNETASLQEEYPDHPMVYVFPQDLSSAWIQIYEGTPAVCQRKNKFKKYVENNF